MTTPISTGRERRVEQTEPTFVEGYGLAYARNNGTRYARNERTGTDRRVASYRNFVGDMVKLNPNNASYRDLILALRGKRGVVVAEERAGVFDMLAHLRRQREWSERTFGPGNRTAGVVDHIRKELAEIEAAPNDLSEWIDVAILALDGAWRCGASPESIIEALIAKQTKNEARTWPDWRTAEPGKAIEHDRAAAAIRGGE